MKFIVTFLCCIAACALQGLCNEEGDGSVKPNTTTVPKYKEGDRYFYFPDGEGKLHLVDMKVPVKEKFIMNYSQSDNIYMLYTRCNRFSPQFLIYGNMTSLRKSSFDPAKDTVFYAHGWKSNGYSDGSKMITAAFLNKKDINVIQFDWSRLAEKSYPTAIWGVPTVGEELGKFILWLTRYGLRFEKTHLVGFSLGAHVVGNAGRATSGLVRRITALDPAGPGWYNCRKRYRIAKTDGKYVEAIHTNAGIFGLAISIGHADFYPNGGTVMPGCGLDPVCAHSRSYEYFASSVENNHLLANNCHGAMWRIVANLCNGQLHPMGNNDLTKSRSGLFRVNTEAEHPFLSS